MNNRLHVLEFPDPAVCDVAALYARLDGTGSVDADGIALGPGATAHLDTYFNCCTVAAWNRAAPLDDLIASVDLEGDGTIEIWNTDSTGSRLVAATQGDGAVSLDVPQHDRLEGIVWMRVLAGAAGSTIRGGGWDTSTTPRRTVRLAVVMTTYNRPRYVQRNLDNLDRRVRCQPPTRPIRLTIVDNGRNLEVDPTRVAFPVEVVPNRNLGGAGGFARGLLEHRAAGWATHLVFADDDIRLPPTLLDRTSAFLAFADRDDQCLSSAMIDESDPARQYECGAGFDTRARHPTKTLRGNLDLTDPSSLVENSRHLPIDYAGWWFFAFPVDLTADSPLPVFVRGDDVEFGFSHTRGRVEVMNGVGVWHQNFDYKNSPVTSHLEARNHPLVCTLADPGYSRRHVVNRFVPLALRYLLAMKYSSAEHITSGLDEFLAGPQVWLGLDHEADLARINQDPEERPGPLTPDQLTLPWVENPTGAPDPWSLLTLAGHLVPRRWSRRGPAATSIQTRPLTGTVGREQIVYVDEPTGHGFVVQRDRRRFFAGLFALARTMLSLWWRFPRTARAYRQRRSELVSADYWQRQFDATTTEPEATDTR